MYSPDANLGSIMPFRKPNDITNIMINNIFNIISLWVKCPLKFFNNRVHFQH